MISREEAIEKATGVLEEASEGVCYVTEVDVEWLITAIEALSQPPADQWNVIKCDEEGIFWHLPDEGEEVILSNGVHVWIDTLESDINGVWFDNYGDIKEGMAWKYAESYRGAE